MADRSSRAVRILPSLNENIVECVGHDGKKGPHDAYPGCCSRSHTHKVAIQGSSRWKHFLVFFKDHLNGRGHRHVQSDFAACAPAGRDLAPPACSFVHHLVNLGLRSQEKAVGRQTWGATCLSNNARNSLASPEKLQVLRSTATPKYRGRMTGHPSSSGLRTV